MTARNLKLKPYAQLNESYQKRYGKQLFSTICDLDYEWPCFRPNAFDKFGNPTSIRPCIKFKQIGDGHIDCLGASDERNLLKHCNEATMLGNDFKCNSSNTCIHFASVCDIRCPHPSDDETQCYARWNPPKNCFGKDDFVCLNGQCAKNGFCEEESDCLYGEDEQICRLRFGSADHVPNVFYRKSKESQAHEVWQSLQLPLFPSSVTGKWKSTLTQIARTTNSQGVQVPPSIFLTCNRGVTIRMQGNTTVCFCPPQYYGDRCQFHSDRIVVQFHLNFTDSIYLPSNNTNLVLKLLFILLFQNRSLSLTEFHVRPAEELERVRKRTDYLLYSHSSERHRSRRARQTNRSNLIHEHPYSLRIEAYELDGDHPPKLAGIWLYPIYFDFLPSFRFAKVLRIAQQLNNSCVSNPCHPKEECQPILNRRSSFICLNANSSETHPLCRSGYCRMNALCKSNYRGLLAGDERPFCICPYNLLRSTMSVVPR